MTPVPTQFPPSSGTGCQTRPDPGAPVPDSKEGTGYRGREAVPVPGVSPRRQGTGVGEAERLHRSVSNRSAEPRACADSFGGDGE